MEKGNRWKGGLVRRTPEMSEGKQRKEAHISDRT
jgi:hypothetical protein